MKKQRLVYTHEKHLPRGMHLCCLSRGQSIISSCLLVCQKSIIEQFCSIKKYLKILFLKDFLHITDSPTKAKNGIATLQKDYIQMSRTQPHKRSHRKAEAQKQESTQKAATLTAI